MIEEDDDDATINAAIRAQLENDGLLSLYSSPSSLCDTNIIATTGANDVSVGGNATLGVYISIIVETDADADSETEPGCDDPPEPGAR